MLNSLTRTKLIKLEPIAGDNLEDFKQLAKHLSKLYKCKVTFWFSANKYIADKDGNCAKVN